MGASGGGSKKIMKGAGWADVRPVFHVKHIVVIVLSLLIDMYSLVASV